MNTITAPAFELGSSHVEYTQALGAALGSVVRSGDVVALQGDLGAGKTNLAQGLARGLGVTEDVNSPTFILANEYTSGRLALYHVDAYRVASADQAAGFGLDDYLNGEGVTVVEWAERVRGALPQDVLWIELEYINENERRLKATAHGLRAGELLALWKSKLDHAVGN